MNAQEILQLCSLSSKSGRLILNVGDTTGEVYVRNGLIIHAQHGTHTGLEAIYPLLQSDCGDVQFIEDPLPNISQSIHLSTDHILLEAARLKDESRPTQTQTARAQRVLPIARPELRLVQIAGEEPLLQFDLYPGEWTLGRAETADLYTPHHTISSSHCLVILKNGNVDIEDLESLNGIYVNEIRIKRARIKPGDILQTGAIAFRLERPTDTFDPIRKEDITETLIEESENHHDRKTAAIPQEAIAKVKRRIHEDSKILTRPEIIAAQAPAHSTSNTPHILTKPPGSIPWVLITAAILFIIAATIAAVLYTSRT